MPITTTSELRSAAQWYPCPPNPDATDLLDDLSDLQTVSWTFVGLTLQTELVLIRALSWHEATRSLYFGETRLASITARSSASRTILTLHGGTRAVVFHDQRTIPLQE